MLRLLMMLMMMRSNLLLLLYSVGNSSSYKNRQRIMLFLAIAAIFIDQCVCATVYLYVSFVFSNRHQLLAPDLSLSIWHTVRSLFICFMDVGNILVFWSIGFIVAAVVVGGVVILFVHDFSAIQLWKLVPLCDRRGTLTSIWIIFTLFLSTKNCVKPIFFASAGLTKESTRTRAWLHLYVHVCGLRWTIVQQFDTEEDKWAER